MSHRQPGKSSILGSAVLFLLCQQGEPLGEKLQMRWCHVMYLGRKMFSQTTATLTSLFYSSERKDDMMKHLPPMTGITNIYYTKEVNHQLDMLPFNNIKTKSLQSHNQLGYKY